MPEEIAVVKPYYAKEEAFKLGREEFSGIQDREGFDLSPYKSSARWANTVAPRLRAMAGFEDSTGKGTFTGNRKVAAVKPGCEEDTPAEAELVEARHIHEELVEAFDNGAFSAVDGIDKDEALEQF